MSGEVRKIVKGDLTMTELQAIKESLHMWKWLNKYPLRDKYDYFEKYPKKDRHYQNSCACCEFYGKNCYNCPLSIRCANGRYRLWWIAVMNKNEKESQIHSQYIVNKLKERKQILEGGS
jgi:hypothetical protein